MWRSPARRALLNTRSASSNLHSQVTTTHLQPTAILTQKTSSHFLIPSPTFYSYQNPRFFSPGPAPDYEDPPVSDPKTTSTGLDFSGLNQFGDGTNLEQGNEDSIFGDAGIADDDIGLSTDLGVVENDVEIVESLLGLLQSGVEGRSLESSLEGIAGLELDEDLFLKVLETPNVSVPNLFVFFRWSLESLEFRVSGRVLDGFVEAVCSGKEAGYLCDLWEMVKKVGGMEKGAVSSECLNRLLARFAKTINGKQVPLGAIADFGELAFEVFSKFEELGCYPNAESYYFTVEALCKRGMYERACSVCEKMLDSDTLTRNVKKVGNIISYLCDGGRTTQAHLVYMYAKDKKICPPRSSVDSLINSLCQTGRIDGESGEGVDKELEKKNVDLALEMLGDYSAEDRKDATKPFFKVMTKLCSIGDVDRAEKLLHQMIESGPSPGNAMFNSIINGRTKQGDLDKAIKIMKLMENRGVQPDIFAYSVVMSGYVRAGSMEEACKIYDEAKTKHPKLQRVTYHSLIRGFCKAGQYDKAVGLLEEMKQHGVRPNHDEYNKLIKSLCLEALDWETAEKLREDMESHGVILSRRTSALINAVKEMKEGEVSAELPAGSSDADNILLT